jgi:hypothetical protein
MFRSKIAMALAVLAGSSAAFAQIQTVWDSFEHHSRRDADVPRNCAMILEEARLAVLDAFEPAWLEHAGSSDDRRAREQAMAEARRDSQSYVALTIRQGPSVRVGTPGYVSARAEVRLDDLQRLYRRKLARSRRTPHYKVLVLISEYKVVGVPRYVRERNDVSRVATAIGNELTEAGWTVMDERQLEVIRERKLDYAHLDQADEKLIARIAKEQGAQIIITGSVKAEGPRTTSVAGRTGYVFSVDCAINACWTDTGVRIFGISEPPGQRTKGTIEAGLNGAERAIETVAEGLAQECRRRFARLSESDELHVVVHGIDALQKEIQVRKWFKAVAGADSIRSDEFSGGRLRLTIETRLSAFEFAAEVCEASKKDSLEYYLNSGDRSANTIEFSLRLQ